MGFPDNGVQEPANSPAVAQDGSIFSLTLDEVQNQLDSLGKPLNSMNFDEFMKTVCKAEAGKSVGSQNVSAQQRFVSDNRQLQASFALSSDLGAKTVDEVWRDIQQDHTENGGQNGNETAPGRQPTLGELTLEDFLAKAGIVAAPPAKVSNENVTENSQNSFAQPIEWMQQQQRQYQQPVVQPPVLQRGNMVPVFLPGHRHAHQPYPISTAYPQNQMPLSSPQSTGTSSDAPSAGRKRSASGEIIDKSVERRHKRMIKNRESAARSRARKQAYIQELEQKLADLEAENAKLQAVKAPSAPLTDTNTTPHLRRTGSAPL